MSLHNSTRETRKWIILLVTKLESGSKQSVSPTNQKPSEAGFDLRGGTAKLSEVFDQSVSCGRKRSVRMLIPTRSSCKERKGNALASGADEGRDKLR